MTSTALDVYARSPLQERARYAQSMAAAADLIPRGLFDNQTGRPSPAKILLVMETGSMLGLHPMAALASIDVIEGKAVIAPRAALGLIRGRGHKVTIHETGTVAGGDLVVTVTLTRTDDPDNPISASFDPHRAARADLCTYTFDAASGVWIVRARSNKGKILPWEAYTEDMCLWRAVGRLGRRGAEDILMGIDYFPEELEVMVTEEGVRDVPAAEVESEFADRIPAIDDRDDMRKLFHEIKAAYEDGPWPAALQAKFDAHLMTITKDSNPSAAPGPGRTGDPDFDSATETGAATAEPGAGDDVAASASVNPQSTPNPAEGHTASQGETEEERYERESAEEFARVRAAEDAAAVGTLFDENVVDAEVIEESDR